MARRFGLLAALAVVAIAANDAPSFAQEPGLVPGPVLKRPTGMPVTGPVVLDWRKAGNHTARRVRTHSPLSCAPRELCVECVAGCLSLSRPVVGRVAVSGPIAESLRPRPTVDPFRLIECDWIGCQGFGRGPSGRSVDINISVRRYR